MRLFPVKEILPINKEQDDLFICATSFEDRCWQSTQLLSPQYKVKQSLVVFYQDILNVKKGEMNLKIIDINLRKYAQDGCKIDGIRGDYRNPFSLISELEKVEVVGPQHKFITIDISCFTKLHLLLLLKYLSQNTKAIFRFLYTKPLSYSTLEGEDKKLSYGFLELVTIKYLMSSETLKKKGGCGILFLGHEFGRAYKALELEEYDDYWVILGSPGYNQQMEMFSENENAYLIREAKADKRLKKVSAENISDTLGCLKEIAEVEKDKANLIFIPCGTKLQTLGIFLFSRIIKNFNLIISYPVPLKYNEKFYSKGIGETYMIFWSNIIEPEGYSLGVLSEEISRKELYE